MHYLGSYDPSYVRALNNRGNAYRKLGQIDRAIQDYDQALMLDPDYVLGYNNRGNAFEELGYFDTAVRDWEEAMRAGGSTEVKEWQEYLKDKGHYSGGIDGQYGPGTRKALNACAVDPQC